ncbi:methylglyoxal reductase (NADPH-dependent) [Diplogelasinospora grovesii]|uniref:Methylglyoxal reductase (NADPH-dependent) n=1 Tax=Diplogelasinospora grovesii TaxID=303347 RepID=A0AAN6S673_9PEZI|nr:methylglyoxal reductase (NADPH-dependent) [Diplogelasinospora grovesii]
MHFYISQATPPFPPPDRSLVSTIEEVTNPAAVIVRFWNCAITGCPNAAAIDISGCERCVSMYYATHIRSALHICEEPLDNDAWLAAQTAELVALNQETNHAALLRRAKELSGGLECRLDDEEPLGRRLDDEEPLGRRQMGGMHIHLQLIFEDGTVWLARILRERHTSFDDEPSNQILLSECATLRWLESLDVPTPRLHGYGLRSDPRNEVGVAYMIIDKLPGRPFNSWAASEGQKSRVLGQWADILCVLGKHPLDKIGSLKFDADGAIEVGPIASDRTGTLPCIGPFEDAKDFYSSWANTYLELITDGQLFSPYSIDAYLMFKFLAERAKAGPWLKKWQGLNSGPFFLKHADDKGDHILIDDDFRITGIIDWSFARAVPAYEAFGPSLVSANTSNLFAGKLGLSEGDRALGRELQRRGAPHCYFESDEMRRFLFGLGMGLGLTKNEAIDVFRGLVVTFDGAMPDWQEWRRASLIQWTNDTRLAVLCQASLGGTPLGPAVHALPTPKVPRFATCSWSNCGRPSVRGRRCQTCMRHLCAVHILPRHHKCPSTTLFSPQRRALQVLSRGALGSGAMMGCANYHSWVVFDDGVKWLARIPRTTAFSDIPPDLVDYLIESEYATLKFLEDLGVPAPKAHGFGLSSDPNNLVGVGYILEDALPGRPFYAHQVTAEQKSHVYNQYADILIDISRLPRNQACSLLPHGEETKEAAIASNRFLSLGKHGPFADPLEYFTPIADLHLDLIADGQLYPEYPKEAFLFYRLLRDRAAPALAAATASTGGFFLKHVDDKGDHLLVDDNYNITAVIDWQFARFVPACEAFGPSLFTADLGNLYSASAALSPDDRILAESLKRKGREDLAEFAGGSELARRFHFGLASGLSRREALGMIGAVLSLLDGKASEKGLRDWTEKEWAQAVGDPRREKVEKLVAELEKDSG